jgi:uncharacterized protein
MSEVLLEEFTRQYIESQSIRQITFAWQGGEPTLMDLDFYQFAVELQQNYRKPGMQILNTIQTNGMGLNREWCLFLKENNFLLGISLDGPRDLHDTYRKDRSGKPTFDRVMRGLNLAKKFEVDFNILACVHAANVSQSLEVYHFLRDRVGAQFIQFIPIVERNHGNCGGQRSMTPHSISGKQYGQFLVEIFNEWIQGDVGKVFVQIFDVALAHWFGVSGGLCVFDQKCGLAMALEHNGDLYSCDHFVKREYRLGNILDTPLRDLASSVQQQRFGLLKLEELPKLCRECEFLFACNGGCPKNRIERTKKDEGYLNHLCEGYKAFFRHISHPMSLMATLIRRGRAPAEVMELLR